MPIFSSSSLSSSFFKLSLLQTFPLELFIKNAPEAYFNKNVDYVFKSTTRENYKQLMEQIENDTDEEIMGIFSKKRQYQSTLPSCQNEYIKPDREMSKKYRKYYN